MNFWKSKKQLIQIRTEISRLEAENEQLSFDKKKLKHSLKHIERQNSYLSPIADALSPHRYLNHIWIEPQYRKENDLEWLEYVKITEFLGKTGEVGKGYGSLNLSVMLEFIKDAFGEKTTVKGWLSPVDERSEDNRNRRNRVYEKFGFKFEGEWGVLDALSNSPNTK
ncbi:hypothetical protein [Lactococcus garvieae]|uniref:hypothetical protein n=1 Tax=Lactococcus garvieae TaxID=1363 RepID=UPI003854DDB9